MSNQLLFQFDFNYAVFPDTDPQGSLTAYLQKLEESVQNDAPIFFNSNYLMADCIKIMRERLRLSKIGDIETKEGRKDLWEISFAEEDEYTKANMVSPGKAKIYYPLADWLQTIKPRAEEGLEYDYRFHAIQTDERGETIQLTCVFDGSGNVAVKEDGYEVSYALGRMRDFDPDRETITIEVVRKFLEDEESVDLWDFTTIEEDAAEALSVYEGELELPEELQAKVDSFKDG